jgi:hypothetical protein
MAKQVKGKSGTTYIIEGGGRRGKSMSMRVLWDMLPLSSRGFGSLRLRKGVEIGNGAILSIQASKNHYSQPREDDAPSYTHFEVLAEGAKIPELSPYAEDEWSSVHPFVPAEVLDAIFKRYGFVGIED